MVLLRLSGHADGPRRVALGPWQEQSKHAVTIFGLDVVGIDLNGERDRPIELTFHPLPAVEAHPLRISDGFSARNSDSVILGLDLQIVFVDTWQLNDR